MDENPSHDTSSRTQTSTPSSRSGTTSSLVVDKRKKRSSRVPERFRQDREKELAGRSNRELIRLLIYEEYEAKDTRKLLNAAFDRLELETRRVAEADARVLEMAERCRNINEARLASHQEAARANEDLRMYKFQYDNAQQEIYRAQDVLKAIEGQRDDAAAAATRARDTARKYRENQLVYVAREEGRKQGYQEGLRHARHGDVGVRAIGYKDRASEYENRPENRFIADEPFNDMDSDEDTATPDEYSPASMNLQGLPSATITEELENKSPLSRAGPSTGAFSPISVALGSSRPVTWPVKQAKGDVTPIKHNGQPVPHPEPPIPPEGWIPHEDENGVIAIPPAHEFERPPPSPSTAATESTWAHASSREPVVMYSQVAGQPNTASTASGHRRRASSPMSTSSFASTSFSQFDITATNPQRDLSPLGRDLSVIPEGSTQGEITPTISGRRSRLETTMTTPALETDYGYSPLTEMTLTSTPIAEVVQPVRANVYKGGPRGVSPGQRFADELRYSDPDIVDTWRRSAAEQLSVSSDRPPRRRPANVTTPAPLSPTSGFSANVQSSSQSSRNSRIPIDVQPPSTPEGYGSDDRPHTPGLLSPYSLPIARPFVSDDESVQVEQPKMVPPPVSRNSEASSSGYGRPYSRSPREPSPDRDPRDRRRSKSTPREPRPQNPYATAPVPEGVNYPTPSPRPRTPYAPQISSSLSAGSASSPRSSVSRLAHDRSLSMNAGATPAHMGRPLSGMSRDQSGSTLRKAPSIASSMSGTSARSSSYKAYNPNEYVDPAFLASSEDLTTMPSSPSAARVASSSRSGRRR